MFNLCRFLVGNTAQCHYCRKAATMNNVEPLRVIREARSAINHSRRTGAELEKRINRLQRFDRLLANASNGAEVRWLLESMTPANT